jgi:hypothetical protein
LRAPCDCVYVEVGGREGTIEVLRVEEGRGMSASNIVRRARKRVAPPSSALASLSVGSGSCASSGSSSPRQLPTFEPPAGDSVAGRRRSARSSRAGDLGRGGSVRNLMKHENKSENMASRTGLVRGVSRGVGTGVDQAPVSRLKKVLLKLKGRRTTSRVVDAGHADAPVRSQRARLRKTVAGRTGRPATRAVEIPRSKKVTAGKTPAKTGKPPLSKNAPAETSERAARKPLRKKAAAKTPVKAAKTPRARRTTGHTPTR